MPAEGKKKRDVKMLLDERRNGQRSIVNNAARFSMMWGYPCDEAMYDSTRMQVNPKANSNYLIEDSRLCYRQELKCCAASLIELESSRLDN